MDFTNNFTADTSATAAQDNIKKQIAAKRRFSLVPIAPTAERKKPARAKAKNPIEVADSISEKPAPTEQPSATKPEPDFSESLAHLDKRISSERQQEQEETYSRTTIPAATLSKSSASERTRYDGRIYPTGHIPNAAKISTIDLVKPAASAKPSAAPKGSAPKTEKFIPSGYSRHSKQ